MIGLKALNLMPLSAVLENLAVFSDSKTKVAPKLKRTLMALTVLKLNVKREGKHPNPEI